MKAVFARARPAEAKVPSASALAWRCTLAQLLLKRDLVVVDTECGVVTCPIPIAYKKSHNNRNGIMDVKIRGSKSSLSRLLSILCKFLVGHMGPMALLVNRIGEVACFIGHDDPGGRCKSWLLWQDEVNTDDDDDGDGDDASESDGDGDGDDGTWASGWSDSRAG